MLEYEVRMFFLIDRSQILWKLKEMKCVEEIADKIREITIS